MKILFVTWKVQHKKENNTLNTLSDWDWFSKRNLNQTHSKLFGVHYLSLHVKLFTLQLEYFHYLQIVWGVSPMIKVVCLVWWVLLVVNVTGCSTLGLCSLVVEAVLFCIGGLSGGLSDKLWKSQVSVLLSAYPNTVAITNVLWLLHASCVPRRWLAGIWENMWRSNTSLTAALLISSSARLPPTTFWLEWV